MKVKLGDITKIKTGKLDANAASDDGEYPFFTCSRDPLKISSYSYDCECVLVAGNGDLNVKYYNGKFDAYQRTYIIEAKLPDVLYMPYLYFFMEKYVVELRKLAIGGVIKYIKLGNLTDALIELPSYEQQRTLVERLRKVKCSIDKRNEQLAKLDELVKCRFVEMFGDLSVYEEKPLNDVCSFIDYRGKTPVKAEAGVPLITAKNVGIGVYSYEPREYIDSVIYDSWMTRGFPRVGDILFTTEAPLGHVCRIPEMSGRFSVGQRLIVIQPDALLLDYDFVSFILQSPDFQEKVLQKSTGSTVRGIRSKELIKLTIPIPPLTQQQTFADFVHRVDKLRFVIQQSLDETQKLFDSLMQEYFD